MEPPRKKQKLSAEQSTLPLLPELRAEILRYLQPDRTIRLRWNIQSVKSALLKISETIAPKLRVYDSLHDRVADEVMEILVELCSVEFRFDQEVLYGFGFALGAGCDINKAATEDLKDFKEVELHLPRLELRYESMAPAPVHANGSTKYEEDIAHFVQILGKISSLQYITVHVALTGSCIGLLSSSKLQHRYVFEHFAKILEPFRALNKCEIAVETKQPNNPQFGLKVRCPEAFDHLEDVVQTINSSIDA
ncbi:hypothetical protein E6O75_ATG11345 [Venturia nashicola]|uniref:Uncharacterized protein n=1 Tax=Venturia nashicola TaxID=86259 RepID=A0A4Z1NXV8_9PEZI|nr:hypothetical protein E6O75_ATG11345 [Venturia nashicola]